MSSLDRLKVFRGVLEPGLLEAVQFYVRERARSGYLTFEDWAHRLVKHDDPFAVLLHQFLTPAVEAEVGLPIKRSYAFVASYLDGSALPRHLDRPQCRYTLDLCVEDSGSDVPWPLHVGGEQILLASNDAVLYRGTELYHHREPKPPGKVVNLIFFHFVDADFEGHLD